MTPCDPESLRKHVVTLARCPRPAGSIELEVAQAYVQQQLEAASWNVRGVEFDAIRDDGTQMHGRNLIATHPSNWSGDRPRFTLGAHLDSVVGSPGADDNASAVAVLLDAARWIVQHGPPASELDLELVVFDLEEHGMLGGAAHARELRKRQVDLRGMVSLEMLGYCDSTVGAQKLPAALHGLYPETGDFIAIVGNQVSSRLITAFRDGLTTVDGLAVETLQVPENGNMLQATRLSDHSPFWDEGFAALMITDTSFLRNPYYHTPDDRPETLDYEFLSRVAMGTCRAVKAVIESGLP